MLLVNDSLDIVELTKKHFGFLVREYGFRYDEKINAFDNGYVRYRIEKPDHINPSIEVWLKSEPKYTRVDVSWLIDEYINYSEIDTYLFEDRLAYYASLFRNHSRELFSDLDKLLLKGIKKLVISTLKSNRHITKDNYQYNLSSASQLYHYVKKKDMKWDPRKYL